MSALLIDIGNSRIKWALLKGDRLGKAQAADYSGWRARDFARRVIGSSAGCRAHPGVERCRATMSAMLWPRLRDWRGRRSRNGSPRAASVRGDHRIHRSLAPRRRPTAGDDRRASAVRREACLCGGRRDRDDYRPGGSRWAAPGRSDYSRADADGGEPARWHERYSSTRTGRRQWARTCAFRAVDTGSGRAGGSLRCRGGGGQGHQRRPRSGRRTPEARHDRRRREVTAAFDPTASLLVPDLVLEGLAAGVSVFRDRTRSTIALRARRLLRSGARQSALHGMGGVDRRAATTRTEPHRKTAAADTAQRLPPDKRAALASKMSLETAAPPVASPSGLSMIPPSRARRPTVLLAKGFTPQQRVAESPAMRRFWVYLDRFRSDTTEMRVLHQTWSGRHR